SSSARPAVFIKNQTAGKPLLKTGWSPLNNNGQKVRLTRDDGTPIRPEDVSVGGQMTVFPGIPGGATNEHADSPTPLIHLRQEDADKLRASIDAAEHGIGDPQQPVVNGLWQNFV